MSGAISAVQVELVRVLTAHAPLASKLSGIYDGPPARAAFPYLAMASGVSADWSHKSARGRELRMAFTIWDDGCSAGTLHSLMGEAEKAVDEGVFVPDGWQLVNAQFLRSRVIRDADGPWAGLVEYRMLVLEN